MKTKLLGLIFLASIFVNASHAQPPTDKIIIPFPSAVTSEYISIAVEVDSDGVKAPLIATENPYWVISGKIIKKVPSYDDGITKIEDEVFSRFSTIVYRSVVLAAMGDTAGLTGDQYQNLYHQKVSEVALLQVIAAENKKKLSEE